MANPALQQPPASSQSKHQHKIKLYYLRTKNTSTRAGCFAFLYIELLGKAVLFYETHERVVMASEATLDSLQRLSPKVNCIVYKKRERTPRSPFSLIKSPVEEASCYARMEATTPAPTVRPPSRIAKRVPSSRAIGAISSTSTVMLSPGITISVPSGRETTPVTSVVRT